MQELLPYRLRLWLAIVGCSTLVLAAAYALAQQVTRLSSDNQPLATAQTVKDELASGVGPTGVVPSLKTDLRTDYSTFVIVTDTDKHVLASSATLDDQTPLPPSGTFNYTNAHGTDHFTWQPTSGVRMATRMLKYDGGYIITGQSLKPAEDHINTYGLIALLAWLAVLAWTTLLILLPSAKLVRRSRK